MSIDHNLLPCLWTSNPMLPSTAMKKAAQNTCVQCCHGAGRRGINLRISTCTHPSQNSRTQAVLQVNADLLSTTMMPVSTSTVAATPQVGSASMQVTATLSTASHTGRIVALGQLDKHKKQTRTIVAAVAQPASPLQPSTLLCVWDLQQPLAPQRVFPVTQDVCCLTVGQRDGGVIAAGTADGFVMVLCNNNNAQTVRTSSDDKSHAAAVVGVHWFDNMRCVVEHDRVVYEQAPGHTQLMSIASDGRIALWNLPDAVDSNNNNDNDTTATTTTTDDNNNNDNDDVPWHYSASCALPHNTSRRAPVMPTTSTIITQHQQQARVSGDAAAQGVAQGVPCALMVGTVLGELLWLPIVPLGGEEEGGGHGGDDGWQGMWLQGHTGPLIALQQRPHIPQHVLALDDLSFIVWDTHNHSHPVALLRVRGVPPTTAYTAAVWSTVEDGVVIAARADGHVELWNTASTHHKPVAHVQASAASLTTLLPLHNLTAVGDAHGAVHLVATAQTPH